MSNPSPVTPTRGGNASRYLFVFLLGLVLGVVAVVMGMRAWDARRDHFHGSVMQVQQWHLKQLDQAVTRNRCSATDTLPHLKSLRVMADDLEPAFPDLADDQRFADAASKLRETLDAALASPPMQCQGVGVVAQKVGEACKACHQDFR
ncbi:cytochrome c [Agrilutibacter solisilvae]|uniref:Cytochrome c n=1 Tax=Agrilutibacter solisilvae TaxID=2763317 RepID=A0A974XYX0_9GAMM|nr:cytochrome c [Lysobacter solisilvae]QSX78193.1 cytochrome c [Lysobacter solisilvae]